MYSLISFCDLHLWHIILSWIVPFLLGLILGWLLWGHFRRRYKVAINERDDFASLASDLEEKLNQCLTEKKMLQESSGAIKSAKTGKPEDQLHKDSEIKSLLSGIPKSSFEKIDKTNLQIIEGIGPKMSEFLHENGIGNWTKLSEWNSEQLNDLLAKAGNRYRIIDPSSWPMQAKMASTGQWDELISFQKHLGGGKSKGTEGKETDAKVEKILIRMGILKKWAKDDLKAIEGIGPKIEKLLQETGINTWRELSNTPVRELKEILHKGGPKFQLADPTTWPKQAKLANEGKWHDLTLLQDELKGGRKV